MYMPIGHVMNAMHQPNTTNIHTHGLHIDPNVDSIYLAAQPGGGTLEYKYQLPAAHSPGLHWYHAHTHGSSAMQLMGGLVGALIVQAPPAVGSAPPAPTPVPPSTSASHAASWTRSPSC